MSEIVFANSRPFTLGVELEFQIIDSQSLDLVPRAPALLARVPTVIQDKVAPEFIRSILEIRTGVCASVDEVAADLGCSIPLLEDIAAAQGSLLYCASLHPFAEPAEQLLSVGERYERIMEELQYVGRQFISQGMHVHVGIARREDVIAVCNVLQAYLPILLGISCSSPYFRGEDTGLCSYRSKLFEVLPLAGIAGYLGSWQDFQQEVDLLSEARVIRTLKDLWWDVRPSPGFGTVEIRACDLPARFGEILGLTSLIQALTAAIVEGMVQPQRLSLQILRCNKWQAVRHGLEGRFTDMLGLLPTRTQTIREAAAELLAVLRPFFDTFGGCRGLDALQNLLDGRISAEEQRRLIKKHGSFKAMITALQSRFWESDV